MQRSKATICREAMTKQSSPSPLPCLPASLLLSFLHCYIDQLQEALICQGTQCGLILLILPGINAYV